MPIVVSRGVFCPSHVAQKAAEVISANEMYRDLSPVILQFHLCELCGQPHLAGQEAQVPDEDHDYVSIEIVSRTLCNECILPSILMGRFTQWVLNIHAHHLFEHHKDSYQKPPEDARMGHADVDGGSEHGQ